MNFRGRKIKKRLAFQFLQRENAFLATFRCALAHPLLLKPRFYRISFFRKDLIPFQGSLRCQISTG